MTSFPAPTPAIHTILRPDALIERVLARYQLPQPITCRLFFSGLNDTYLVGAGSDRYTLRVYRTGAHPIEAIRYELDLLRYLAAQGAHVSAPVSQPNGELLTILSALEGTPSTASSRARFACCAPGTSGTCGNGGCHITALGGVVQVCAYTLPG